MRTFWNFLKSKFLWINILAAILLVVIICFIVFFNLDLYTHHGESVEVPDLSGLYVQEAELLLKEKHLSYEVIDSVYLRSLKPGEIAEQSPSAGTLVKKSRKIYLTINKISKRLITVPNVIGDSKRKVQTNLASIGFNASRVIYRPYEYNDEVLELRYDGKIIEPGSQLPDGAKIVLVVGRNNRSIDVVVPSLIGLNIKEASEKIKSNKLSLGMRMFDVEPLDTIDEKKYIVYEQTPEAGVVVNGGRTVDLKLSKDQQNNDEEFF